MILGQEPAPHDRLNPHQGKEILGDGGDHRPRRFGPARDRLHPSSIFGQPLQGMTLRPDILKIGVGKIHLVAAVVQFP